MVESNGKEARIFNLEKDIDRMDIRANRMDQNIVEIKTDIGCIKSDIVNINKNIEEIKAMLNRHSNDIEQNAKDIVASKTKWGIFAVVVSLISVGAIIIGI